MAKTKVVEAVDVATERIGLVRPEPVATAWQVELAAAPAGPRAAMYQRRPP